MNDEKAGDDPIAVPIDGTLDLHTFSPREIKDLIPDYLRECRERGIDQVRIVHGKGTGTLRRTVQAILGRLPEVREFRTALPAGGGWGATIVTLHPAAGDGEARAKAEAGRGAGEDRVTAGRRPAADGDAAVSAPERALRLTTLDERLAICRLPPDAGLPELPGGEGRLVSVTRTGDELSVVCAEHEAPPGANRSDGWRALRVAGTLDFAETGVLSSLAAPLAQAGIAIFVVSTYDTDYLLVKEAQLDAARRCLRAAGHRVDGS